MIKTGRNSSFLLLSFAIVLCNSGCQKSPERSNAPQQTTQGRKPGAPQAVLNPRSSAGNPQQGASVQTQASSVRAARGTSLDFTVRKDPFKPYIQPSRSEVKAHAEALNQRRGVDLLPIQTYDVEQFKVSGIIVESRERQALLIDPKGKGYVVKEGMVIGGNDGVITKIAASYVEVLEKIKDDAGRLRKRIIKLALIRKK